MNDLTSAMLDCLRLMEKDPEGALQLTPGGYWTAPSLIKAQRVPPWSKVLFSTVSALERRGMIARRPSTDFPQPRVLTEAGREALQANPREEAS